MDLDTVEVQTLVNSKEENVKITKLKTMGGSLRLLGVAAFAVVLASSAFGGASVHAATKTWDGGGSDNKFSTAENWSDDVAPVAGDVLRFATAPEVAEGEYTQELDNDLGIAFGGLETSLADESNKASYTLRNDITLSDSALWSVDGLFVHLSGEQGAQLIAEGDITFSGHAPSNIRAEGVITLTGGAMLMSLPETAAGLVIENDSSVDCVSVSESLTIDYPVTLGGGAGVEAPLFAFGACAGGGAPSAPEPVTVTVEDLTLQGDAQFGVPAGYTVDVKNLTDNGHALTRTAYSQGILKTPSGTEQNEAKKTTYEGNQPEKNETVVLNETATLAGTRGFVNVSYGGTLKGEGTVSGLSVSGVVSPGNSAGTITVVDSLMFGADATYVVELFGADSYDQLVVQSGATIVTVDGTLDLRIEGAVAQGDTFTIIDNQSDTPVSGTFAGLAEGDRVTIGDAVFSISYEGGDGNDVVLTALTTVGAPDAPNTGVKSVATNPVAVLATGLVAASALVVIARRFA